MVEEGFSTIISPHCTDFDNQPGWESLWKSGSPVEKYLHTNGAKNLRTDTMTMVRTGLIYVHHLQPPPQRWHSSLPIGQPRPGLAPWGKWEHTDWAFGFPSGEDTAQDAHWCLLSLRTPRGSAQASVWKAGSTELLQGHTATKFQNSTNGYRCK